MDTKLKLNLSVGLNSVKILANPIGSTTQEEVEFKNIQHIVPDDGVFYVNGVPYDLDSIIIQICVF